LSSICSKGEQSECRFKKTRNRRWRCAKGAKRERRRGAQTDQNGASGQLGKSQKGTMQAPPRGDVKRKTNREWQLRERWRQGEGIRGRIRKKLKDAREMCSGLEKEIPICTLEGRQMHRSGAVEKREMKRVFETDVAVHFIDQPKNSRKDGG